MIRKRGKSYQVYVYDPAQRKKVSVGTRQKQSEARKLERDKTEEFAKRRRMTVAVFRERWLEDRAHPNANRRWEPSTLQRNTERTNLLAAALGDRLLTEVTPDEAVRLALQHRSAVPAWRTMFNYAIQLRLVDHNPFAKLGLETPRRRLEADWLTADDVERLVSTCAEVLGPYGWHYAGTVMFAAYTCIRPGELFALDWSALNLDDLEAQINWQIRPDGTRARPKNKQPRTVVVPPPVVDYLAEMPRLNPTLVFSTVRGNQFRRGSHYRNWEKVAAAFGRPTMDFYELRHFGATYLLDELGLSEYDVSIQMGHTDGGELVRTVYGHRSEARALDRIKQAWTAQVPVAA